MHSVWFGEFLGTLVLVLLGNGVCANVSLPPHLCSRRWLDGRHHRLGHRRSLRRACRSGLRQSRRQSQSGHHSFDSRIIGGNYSQLLSIWSAQLLGAICGSAIMALHFAPHWSITPDPAAKLGVFCTSGAINHPSANFVSEVIGTMVLVVVANSIFSHGVSPLCRSGPVARRQPRVGHRPLARRNHRLCHQPRSRPRPAHCPCDPAHPRQRRF